MTTVLLLVVLLAVVAIRVLQVLSVLLVVLLRLLWCRRVHHLRMLGMVLVSSWCIIVLWLQVVIRLRRLHLVLMTDGSHRSPSREELASSCKRTSAGCHLHNPSRAAGDRRCVEEP